MSYPPDFPPPRTPIGPSQRYMLTREEKKVLKECGQESFYQRCLPFMTTLGIGAYYGVNSGYLKKNATYGAVPKVVIGVVVGFLAGKLSYQEQCEEKILRLPGGKLKESVLVKRNRQNGLWSNDVGSYGNANYARPSYRGQNNKSYDESGFLSDSEVERSNDFFDDSFKSRLDLSDDSEQILPNVSPSQSVSYNELRYHNRDEFDSRRRQYRPGPMDDYSPYGEQYSSAAQSPSPRSYIKPENDDRYNRSIYADDDPAYSAPPQPRVSVQRKNFFGDIIER